MKTDALVLPVARIRTADFVALAKPRLNFLVILTATAGFYLGAADRVDLLALLPTMVGTGLVAGGAAALNQLFERDVDGLMQRTRLRPLPDGRVQPSEALRFGVTLSAAGLLILAAGANLLSAVVALATLASYVAVYTPMKRRTAHAIVLGAVPGALPPVIGWAAARGNLDLPAWILFGIVFLWQIPHFLAIAWIYRQDYARAGFPMLPVIEPDGRSTARQVLLYAAVLVPCSLAPALVGVSGAVYLAGAALLSVAYLIVGVRFAILRSLSSARWLFLGSIIYLPLLWGLLVLDRLPR